jgi:acetolactate synthase regulatory subunit
MIFSLRLRLRRDEGALLRLIGVVRRRGYEVLDLEAHTTQGGASMEVLLTLESERSAEVLERHVAKLVEVEVVVSTQKTQKAGAR